MKFEDGDGFGDLDDDVDLPTEADIKAILHERNGVDDERKKKRQKFGAVLSRNIQDQPSAWKGEDLAWLRTELNKFKTSKKKKITVNCTNVCMMHEGTFSLFQDVALAGKEIYLLNPTPAVRRWRWFQMFAKECGENCFRLNAEAFTAYSPIASRENFETEEDEDDE